MLKSIICQKQSHINKLPDVFIDNREYKEGEITDGSNTFPTNIGSNLAKTDYLTKWIFSDTLPNLIVIAYC